VSIAPLPLEPSLPRLILDTNIVLDVFVFQDAAAQPIRDGLAARSLDWIATAPMRIELERVLGYPQIVPRLAFYELSAGDVLAHFDAHARLVPVPAKASVTCSDADDQMFIDLAVAHRCTLLSKDKAVTSMAKRLQAFNVRTQKTL
jgi:predicted nucleic acid-binding protein